MVGNVLSHARLEDRRGPRHVESLSLASLIERVRPPLERAASASGMTLDIGTAESSAEPLTVDPDAIGQILVNLVDNAAKYARGAESETIALLAPGAGRVMLRRPRNSWLDAPPSRLSAS